MPYKDPERKKEWERLHRPQRLARRRELRRIAEAQEVARPEVSRVRPEVPSTRPSKGPGFPGPLAAGGALAAYNPNVGMAAGGATLAIVAIFKKRWIWWALGVLIALAIFLYWYIRMASDETEE